jgi:hypothetical protein
MMVNQLAGLPTEFDAFRNAITGEIGGCVAALEGDSCFANALGSVRSAVFRSRGIGSSYSANVGRTQFGVAVGYDQRRSTVDLELHADERFGRRRRHDHRNRVHRRDGREIQRVERQLLRQRRHEDQRDRPQRRDVRSDLRDRPFRHRHQRLLVHGDDERRVPGDDELLDRAAMESGTD